jgi:UDP-N-acetylmuramate--alanine ligase
VVVHPHGGDFDRIDISGNEIIAGAGAKFKDVAYASKAAGLGGLEWMEGIPAEVGGALRMNAGAMGAQTFENVSRVRFLDGEGNAQERAPVEMEIHYRDVPELKNNYAVSAIFRGIPSAKNEIVRKLAESQKHRRVTQPAASSAGCIFKNTDSIPAGKLVDELGLKNCAVGRARVSEVHGNFIVNDGGATAAEMLELIEKIQATARRQRGIALETEVQIVGESE